MSNHDFGVVRPDASLSHEFAIHNPTNVDWHLRSMSRSCVCAVVDASSTVIPAQGTEQFYVRLRTGSQTGEKHEGVEINFNEPESPVVSLRLHASVREPLSALPAELHLPPVGGGHEVEGNFQLHNYSESDWTGVETVTTPEWLDVKIEAIPAKVPSVRQSWQATVSTRTEGLPYLGHSGIVRCKVHGDSVDSPAATTDVRVYLTTLPPVRVSPSQLFFGQVPSHGAATKCLIVQFSHDKSPAYGDELPATIDGPSCVCRRITRLSETLWRIEAEIRGEGRLGYVRETLTIRFNEVGLPEVAVPIVAHFVEANGAR